MGPRTRMPGRDKVCEESHSDHGEGEGSSEQRERGDEAGEGPPHANPKFLLQELQDLALDCLLFSQVRPLPALCPELQL